MSPGPQTTASRSGTHSPPSPGNRARLTPPPQVTISIQITSEIPREAPMSRPALRVCRKPTMSSFPRSSTPHHTIASAQVLPDRPYFGVVGTLGAGDEIDLYQLTLNSISERLDFGLVIAGIGRQRASDIPDTGRLRPGAGYVEAREPGQFIHPGRSRETQPGLHPVPGRLGRQLEHTRWSFRDRQLSALGGSPAGAPPDVLIDRQLDSARPGLTRAFSAADPPGRPGTVILARRFRGSPDRTGDRIHYRECDRRLAGNPLGWGFPGVVVKRRTRSARRAGTRHLGSSRGCRGVPCQARVGT